MAVHSCVHANGPDDRDDRDYRRAVYQRRAFDWMDKRDQGHKRGHFPVFAPQYVAPPVSSGWFQRPYPYHLDYYKMRYGGSYAPYFGNLYGPPQVVTAPPYYGPYYGEYGAGYPTYPNGEMYGSPAPPTTGDALPAPSP
jgi:hypothetical protein